MMTGNNHARSKQLNKALILQTVLREGPLSRLNIANQTGLTPATITNLTSELLQDGVIQEIGDIQDVQKARAGRKAIGLDINPGSFYALGVHVRQDRIEAGIMDFKGRVVKDYYFPFEEVPDQREIMPLLLRHAETILAENQRLNILGIGLGSIGLVDYAGGEIISAKNMGWEQVRLVEFMRSHVPVPVYLDNNVNAMALAEKLFGRAKATKNFIFIYIGRGIGSGLVSNGEIYRRGRAGSGEFGHMTYEPDGQPCWCGNHGCLELYASGRVLMKAFNMSRVKELAESARQGNADAMAAIRDAGYKIGTCLASFNNIFHIEQAVIGGPLADEELPLVESIRNAVNERSYLANIIDPIDIYASNLKEHVGIVGAASLVFNEHFFTV